MHILGSLRPSGMERMLVSASTYFRAADVQSFVIGQGETHPFADTLSEAGYSVEQVPSIAKTWNDVRNFRRMVRANSIDVVHIHVEANYLRNVLAARWALGKHGSIIRTVHSIFPATGRWWLSRFVQATIADRFTKAIIAPSPDVAAVERRIGRRTQTIMNWVDDRIFELARQRARSRRRRDGRPIGLILGNCGAVKNHDIALEALSKTDHALFHLGDERDASPGEIATLDALEGTGRLKARGPATPDTALLEADYFMLPSEREGMSVALAEALTVGIPAIINDAPGLRWAADALGVTVIRKAEDWETVLLEIDWYRQIVHSPHDFSARRGVDDYIAAYRFPARKSLRPDGQG